MSSSSEKGGIGNHRENMGEGLAEKEEKKPYRSTSVQVLPHYLQRSLPKKVEETVLLL